MGADRFITSTSDLALIMYHWRLITCRTLISLRLSVMNPPPMLSATSVECIVFKLPTASPIQSCSSEQGTWSPLIYRVLCTSSAGGLLFPGLLVTTALTLRLIIISFRPAWLARDTALASSVHSLQEMTDADEGRKTPFGTLMIIYARVTHLGFRWLLICL